MTLRAASCHALIQLPRRGLLQRAQRGVALAEALSRRQRGEVMRDAVLAHGPYQGLQPSIAFDRFGDTTRMLHFAVVRGGRFEVSR